MEPQTGDALGCALLAAQAGHSAPVIVERDDGFIDVDGTDYFGGLSEADQWAVAQATGRVLDVGAGAGRAALALQERGQAVTALDTSPGAAEVCLRRGVREVYLGTVREAAAGGLAGTFDAALLLGNSLGLISPGDDGSFLRDLGRLLKPDGIIVGGLLDPYQTSSPLHLAYHERNRGRGRLPGQLTLRVRYQNLATDWFEWLAASPDELAVLAAREGWRVTSQLPGASFASVLRRA